MVVMGRGAYWKRTARPLGSLRWTGNRNGLPSAAAVSPTIRWGSGSSSSIVPTATASARSAPVTLDSLSQRVSVFSSSESSMRGTSTVAVRAPAAMERLPDTWV